MNIPQCHWTTTPLGKRGETRCPLPALPERDYCPLHEGLYERMMRQEARRSALIAMAYSTGRKASPTANPESADAKLYRDKREQYEAITARHGNDYDYRSMFSTMTKIPLRKGETWRGRAEKWLAHMKERIMEESRW